MPQSPSSGPSGAGFVLSQGWRLFLRGLVPALPWIVAAELLPALPFLHLSGNLLDMDLGKLLQPGYLGVVVICGVVQAFCYGMAVMRLAAMTDEAPAAPAQAALRAVVAVCIAYVLYELVVIAGLLVTMLFFSIGLMLLGPMLALIACLIPLAPTAAASTALAFFIYPAVLEHKGAVAALQRSRQLTMRAWGRATLVISVPALALLAVWLGENAGSVAAVFSRSLQQLFEASEEGGGDAVQAVLSSGGFTDAATAHPWLHLVWAGIGAVVWWYTLAVCYAEYRALETRTAH